MIKSFTLQEMFLIIARTQLNVKEYGGANSGSSVSAYLASVGLRSPAPSCMAFVQWVVENSCKEFGTGDILDVNSGGVLDTWNRVNSKHKVLNLPAKGDIFIMDFGGGKGHTGFVEGVANGVIHTIEGNSNDEGSREGFEVCRKPNGRRVETIKGYIRFDV